MRKRPPIVFMLSALCVLFPLILVAQALLIGGGEGGIGGVMRRAFWPDRPLLFRGENVLATGIAWGLAAAVFSVRKWSWWLLLAFVTLWGARDVVLYVTLGHVVAPSRLWAFTGLTLVPLAALSVLLQRETRAPYFNPRIRWWESTPRYPFDAEVASGGRALDISREGVFVACDDPPAEGEALTLELRLGDRTLRFPGQVAWRSGGDSGHPRGYGFRFGDLSTETRAALSTLLREQKRLGRKQWGERAVRYPTDIRCDNGDVVLDLSLGGMFVRSSAPRRLGDRVAYSLHYEEYDIPVRGEVVWLSSGEGKYPPGHGVRFGDLAPDARAALGRLVYDLWLARQKPVPRQA